MKPPLIRLGKLVDWDAFRTPPVAESLAHSWAISSDWMLAVAGMIP